jgi:putative AlgH/UPF0301 family transcriptional regulator
MPPVDNLDFEKTLLLLIQSETRLKISLIISFNKNTCTLQNLLFIKPGKRLKFASQVITVGGTWDGQKVMFLKT